MAVIALSRHSALFRFLLYNWRLVTPAVELNLLQADPTWRNDNKLKTLQCKKGSVQIHPKLAF